MAPSGGPVAADSRNWRARAAIAEAAVHARYVRALPGAAWARSAWPPRAAWSPRAAVAPEAGGGAAEAGGGAAWHYWWSAFLLDAAASAAHDRPSPGRRRFVRAVVRGIRIRNGGLTRRIFWDDLAWLGLAAERADRTRVADRIAARLAAAVDPGLGLVPWHVGSALFNAPANAPAALLLARTGRIDAAVAVSDAMHAALRDPATGLLVDGVDRGPRTVRDLYTYSQGVAFALDADLALRTADARFVRRGEELVAATAAWAGGDGVLPGRGGGDGGLFAGIAVRFIADAATAFADAAAAGIAAATAREAAASARRLVTSNAQAVWATRATALGAPLFSADARRPADPAPGAPERDLSVQLGAWLTLEAAADLAR